MFNSIQSGTSVQPINLSMNLMVCVVLYVSLPSIQDLSQPITSLFGNNRSLYGRLLTNTAENGVAVLLVDEEKCSRNLVLHGTDRQRKRVPADPLQYRLIFAKLCRAFTTVTRNNSNGCNDTVIRTQIRALHGTRASPWAGEVRAKKPSLTLNLGVRELNLTWDQRLKGDFRTTTNSRAGRRAACTDRIAQRSPVQAAATLGVALVLEFC
ncbi:hypothetical protein J6590_094323 [Homalodisca vitripennis]|nr:hypothetical protein J6590_094323 [Homalodisca vitripennis]